MTDASLPGIREGIGNLAAGDRLPVAQKRVVVGMNRGQVLKSWGAPYKIDVTYTDSGVRRELWVFEDWIDSATVKHRYLYFEEDALVGGWY